MKFYIQNRQFISILALTLATLLCTDQLAFAQLGNNSPVGGPYRIGPQNPYGNTGGSNGASSQQREPMMGPSQPGLGSQSSQSGSQQENGPSLMSNIASSVLGSPSSSSSQAPTQSPSSSSSSSETTTAKPEGLLGIMKGMLKDGRDKLKSNGEEKKPEQTSPNGQSNSTSATASGGGGLLEKVSGIAKKATEVVKGESSVSDALKGRDGGLNDKAGDLLKKGKDSAKENVLDPLKGKEGGIVEKAGDMLKKGKETILDPLKLKEGGLLGKAGEMAKKGKEGVKENVGEPQKGKEGGLIEKAGDMLKKGKEVIINKELGPVEKMEKLATKGVEAVKETVQKVEDKALSIEEKVGKTINDHMIKPMQSVSGSSSKLPEGQMSPATEATSNLSGDDKVKYLEQLKKEQDSKMPKPSTLKEIINGAKSKGLIPPTEDTSVLAGNHADEKSLTVEVLDKAQELSKIPMEKVLKPIDRILGYEKDPLLRVYDNGHDALRGPISAVAKPVESLVTGAFKTTDESKRDSEKLLATSSQQERKEVKAKEEKEIKADRSVIGNIADKYKELALKPFEIVLRPIDHVLGLDEKKKKNPLIKLFDEVYKLSKKPIDAIAKPIESILRKMGDPDQFYHVSMRVPAEETDPKIATRLADGALNIADRVMTKPLEFILKPLDHALGYDEQGKKNPIVEAAHSLKNATKVGAELFTKPIDEMIKEISRVGEKKSEYDRSVERDHQAQNASRATMMLDKVHELFQAPFEIVLRPVSRALGMKDTVKSPPATAWDTINSVIRTPLQIVSKPIEDAILGERKHKRKSHPKNIGGSKEIKTNHIVDGIKKVERIAVKPIEMITSPVRKLILGEDNDKVGSLTDKSNREIQTKALAGAVGASSSSQDVIAAQGRRSKQPDKIVKTVENLNNVALRPLEVMTQPISDIFWHDNKKKNESSQQAAQSQATTQTTAQPQAPSQVQAQTQPTSLTSSQPQSQPQTQTQPQS